MKPLDSQRNEYATQKQRYDTSDPELHGVNLKRVRGQADGFTHREPKVYVKDHRYSVSKRRCNNLQPNARASCGDFCLEKCKNGHPCGKPSFKCVAGCTIKHSCGVLISKRRACGHSEELPCGAPEDMMPCLQKVSVTLPSGETKQVVCGEQSQSTQPAVPGINDDVCGTELSCGHRCPGPLGHDSVHWPCESPCSTRLSCGHPCSGLCDRPCPPCNYLCKNTCRHENCRRLCHDICSRCEQECELLLPDGSYCDKKCHQPCESLLPLIEPCEDTLECGHLCVGLKQCECLCFECNTMLLAEHKILSCEERVIKLACQHVWKVIDLDRLVLSASFSKLKAPSCPKCGESISCARYTFSGLAKRVQENQEQEKKALEVKCKEMKTALSRISFNKVNPDLVKTLATRAATCEQIEMVGVCLELLSATCCEPEAKSQPLRSAVERMIQKLDQGIYPSRLHCAHLSQELQTFG